MFQTLFKSNCVAPALDNAFLPIQQLQQNQHTKQASRTIHQFVSSLDSHSSHTQNNAHIINTTKDKKKFKKPELIPKHYIKDKI